MVCREFGQAEDGTWTCYVAVHVPIKDVLNETVDQLGILETDFNRQQFRAFMEAELKKQADEKDAEKQMLLQMREEMNR